VLLRIIRWIIGLPFVILVIGFVIANRQWTRLSLDPFSSESPILSINMPLWALFIFGVFIGILAGWSTCWLGRKREITLLQNEIENNKAQRSAQQAIVPDIGLMP
jgi:fructose-specific phosphotransferase system IIC component